MARSRVKNPKYADSIRKSTAAVTGKLERWSQLSDLYFEDVMPKLVGASAKAANHRSMEPANGDMYQALQEADLRASERVSKEELETSYMELYRYIPELQKPFDDTIEQIKTKEETSHDDLKDALQTELTTCVNELVTGKGGICIIGNKAIPVQIKIGNRLRIDVQNKRERTHAEIEQITRTLRAKMLCVIRLPDDQLRNSPTRGEAVIKILNAKLSVDAKDINSVVCPK